MRAKAAYRLLVGRDTVEVVDIADGETLLLWDLAPSKVRRFARWPLPERSAPFPEAAPRLHEQHGSALRFAPARSGCG